MLRFLADFSTALSGFLVPAVACITVYIAYQQYKIEKGKFKLSLYNKRMEVFQSLMDLLECINKNADITNEELKKFSVATDRGFFLFDSKINNYLSEVRDRCFWLNGYAEKMSNLGQGKERTKLAKEKGSHILWLLDQFTNSKKIFEKDLKIKP